MIETTKSKTVSYKVFVFCLLYLGLQLFLIIRGHFTPSKHFGFWMFPESTFFVAKLYRRLENGKEVLAPFGSWSVKDAEGKLKRYEWRDFVSGYEMEDLGVRTRSKGTFSDTSRYFEEALNFIAVRIPEDTETKQLVLKFKFDKAGLTRDILVLRSHER